eukprot:TRINITY_DN19930_c0_g1_i1.p1 TRINITY_DN19930_c0_g1~~TRINITY_DN19930_c0_g1_i1.p1  ORF type:complete len:399 (+),score=64.28 TRINITY_DN19930_c0_g1_i1:54-1199(+)
MAASVCQQSVGEVAASSRHREADVASNKALEEVYGSEQIANGVTHASDPVAMHVPASKIEELLEQQNRILLRQIQLAEEKHQESDAVRHYVKGPRELLAGLEPSLRNLCSNWRKEFRALVRVYVVEKSKLEMYKKAEDSSMLIDPLAREAGMPWNWSRFYRIEAKPIEGIDSFTVASAGVTSDLLEGEAQDPCGTNSYDVDVAYADLRHKHAQELQSFIFAHQQACVDNMKARVSLEWQISKLEQQFDEWVLQHSGQGFSSEAIQYWRRLSKGYVERVFHDEMAYVERVAIRNSLPLSASTIASRVALAASMLLLLLFVEKTYLINMFCFFFSLLCGCALVWEDRILAITKFFLGDFLWLHGFQRITSSMSTWRVWDGYSM